MQQSPDHMPKISKPLTFIIDEPLSMGLSRGEVGLSSPGLLMVYAVSIPSLGRQTVYLRTSNGVLGSASPRSSTDVEKLTNKTDGRVVFKREDSVGDEIDHARCGFVNYWPEFESSEYGHSASYKLTALLSEGQFKHLRTLSLSGNKPTSITVWTSDVEFGNDPDGYEVVWDVREKPQIGIDGFSIEHAIGYQKLTLLQGKSESDTDEVVQQEESYGDIKSKGIQQMRNLNSSISRLQESLVQNRRRLDIIIIVMIVSALVFLAQTRL